MNQENLPKTEVLYLARKLIAEKKEYAFQPIYRADQKIEIPLNHYNGTPRCIFDGQQYKKTLEHQCLQCKQKYQYKDIYYDLSLHQILQTVWENPQYFHTKSIKMYKNGAWEVLTVDAVETKCEGIIDDIFQSLNQSMASQLIGANDKGFISQSPNLYSQVKQILDQHLTLQKQDIQHLTQGMDFQPIMQQESFFTGVKVRIPKLNIEDDSSIGVLDRIQARDQVKEAQLYDDTQFIVVQDNDPTVYMIGGDKNESGRSNGYKKTYRLQASQYLMDQSMNFSKPICIFQEFASLNEQRYNFRMIKYQNFLYAIGGDRVDFSSINGQSSRRQIQVNGVERLNIQEQNPKWVTVTHLPFCIYKFNYKLEGSVLTMTDGQIAEGGTNFVKQSGKRQTVKFDLEKLVLL